jgi:hypothetical protein
MMPLFRVLTILFVGSVAWTPAHAEVGQSRLFYRMLRPKIGAPPLARGHTCLEGTEKNGADLCYHERIKCLNGEAHEQDRSETRFFLRSLQVGIGANGAEGTRFQFQFGVYSRSHVIDASSMTEVSQPHWSCQFVVSSISKGVLLAYSGEGGAGPGERYLPNEEFEATPEGLEALRSRLIAAAMVLRPGPKEVSDLFLNQLIQRTTMVGQVKNLSLLEPRTIDEALAQLGAAAQALQSNDAVKVEGEFVRLSKDLPF